MGGIESVLCTLMMAESGDVCYMMRQHPFLLFSFTWGGGVGSDSAAASGFADPGVAASFVRHKIKPVVLLTFLFVFGFAHRLTTRRRF